jgi:hypothetical protein
VVLVVVKVLRLAHLVIHQALIEETEPQIKDIEVVIVLTGLKTISVVENGLWAVAVVLAKSVEMPSGEMIVVMAEMVCHPQSQGHQPQELAVAVVLHGIRVLR